MFFKTRLISREMITTLAPCGHIFSRVKGYYSTYSNLKSQSRNSFNSAERTEFFRPVFEAAVKPPVALEASATTEDQLDEQSLETLPEVPLADCRRLTEKEEKRLRRKEDAKLRELRIFLR